MTESTAPYAAPPPDDGGAMEAALNRWDATRRAINDPHERLVAAFKAGWAARSKAADGAIRDLTDAAAAAMERALAAEAEAARLRRMLATARSPHSRVIPCAGEWGEDCVCGVRAALAGEGAGG